MQPVEKYVRIRSRTYPLICGLFLTRFICSSLEIKFYFSYRTREEIQDVRKSRDPITSFREKSIQAKLATNEDFKVYIQFS
jgi:TPP-dependent pyruvate/acetoin dehydrogenase alpha subunit